VKDARGPEIGLPASFAINRPAPARTARETKSARMIPTQQRLGHTIAPLLAQISADSAPPMVPNHGSRHKPKLPTRLA
jgi:hypothetical protein